MPTTRVNRVSSTAAITVSLIFNVPDNAVLEDLFQMFNLSRPQDFEGHSLSVSDVIALKRNGEISVHYVEKFADAGVRDIKSYNAKMDKLTNKDDPDYQKMPQIVIIVDEFADLMIQTPPGQPLHRL